MIKRSGQRTLGLCVLGFIVFAVSVALMSLNPQKASADICDPNGRPCYYGYFYNGYDGGAAANGTRHNLLTAPALLNVKDGFTFVNTIQGYLGCAGDHLANPNAQNPTGAAFIVLTMLGMPPGTDKNVACQRFDEWESDVYNLEASGHGLIRFNEMHDFGGINTRSTISDVAYYPNEGAAYSIVIYNPQNPSQVVYAVKKDCGNPVGRLLGASIDWDLTPTVQSTVNGTVSDTAEAGDSITFTFSVNNAALTDSQDVDCSGASINHSGYFQAPPTPESGGTPVGGLGCPRSFPRSSVTTLTTQTVSPAAANTTYCKTLTVDPATPGGSARSTEKCVTVVSKPYLQVFGGDVSAGADVESAPDTCSSNPSAVVGWNKNTAASGYAGAGIQYAAQALGVIKEFATAQQSPTAGAPSPSGLAFANTTAAGNKYGGAFGSVKCIKDYYSQKPASTTAMPANVSSMVTGSYAATSSATLGGGNVNPGQKTTVFIDGDLYITGNITYTGSWAYNQIPLFEVVVRGNIYIDRSVTQLDGVYIAQPWSDLSHGYVYTCTTGPSAPTLAAGAFYNSCNSQLKINGSVVTRSMQLLRTANSLINSSASQDRTTTKAAETFNYGPGFWITQPDLTTTSGGEMDNYDAITSLPPVL